MNDQSGWRGAIGITRTPVDGLAISEMILQQDRHNPGSLLGGGVWFPFPELEVVMRNGPQVIAWDVICPSAVEARSVGELLAHEADLNAVVVVPVTGGGTTREEVHHLCDYFQAIRVERCLPEEPHALRVVFQRLPQAGHYWRDLMVGLLRSILKVGPGITIAMAYRVEEQPGPDSEPQGTAVG